MTGQELDLTAAIEASRAPLLNTHLSADEFLRAILEAALPHIREALAQQIESMEEVYPPGYFSVQPSGLVKRERAARIVRGEP